MSDKEAYELLLKYCGGEKGLAMIREMILVAGVEVAIKNTIDVLYEKHPTAPQDFHGWIRQSYNYIEEQMNQPLN